MTQINRRRVRLKLDVAGIVGANDPVVDVLTNRTPASYRGNDVQFEIGLFNDDSIVSDLSNVASLEVVVKDNSDRDGAALASVTLTNAELTACDASQWTDGTSQHALVVFPRNKTGLNLNSQNSRDFFLAVGITTNDATAREFTAGHTIWTIVEDGVGTDTEPPGDINTYYTAAVADARFQQQHADGASVAFKDGKHPYLYCSGTGKWHPLTLTQVDGSVVLSVGQTGEDSV